MSIISLNRVTLEVAGNSILDEAEWQIESRDRIALLGRNGAGKSTLLKLLQGELTPDRGVINRLNGLKIAGLPQEVPLNIDEPVYHFLVKGLGDVGEILADYYRLSRIGDIKNLSLCQQKMDEAFAWDLLPQVEMMASRLDIDPNANMKALSGGMKRRALLAAALIAAPDLLLLDEPTNHLDINAIEWLESYLKNWHGSLVVVTHDRAFLSEVANCIVEIDRGKLSSFACDYNSYLDRREARLVAENTQNALFDKRLSDEETWIRTGIKARRTRNEGRVVALKAMREEYKARKVRMAKVSSLEMDVGRSGFIIFDVNNIEYKIQDRSLFKKFSLLVTRGDKLGIIGPNGSGKTTLLRLLLGEIPADSGSIKRGTSLEIAYFDQLRGSLIPEQTVMQNVADGADYVTINGKQKHVASYLRDFLFAPERFNQPVATLSGGERNRLLLAKLFAKPVNLLIMDEPTNDLDIETLELLENMLMAYKGTLLLISHDRAFIDQVVSSVLVFEEEGVWCETVGGYEEYRTQKKQRVTIAPKVSERNLTAKKISFNEVRELEQLPKKIEKLEQKIANLHQKMADPDFYRQDTVAIGKIHKELFDEEKMLSDYYARWECLEDKT